MKNINLVLFILVIGLLEACSVAKVQIPSGGIDIAKIQTQPAMTTIPLTPEIFVDASPSPYSQLAPSSTPTLSATLVEPTINPTYLNFASKTPTPSKISDQISLEIVAPGEMSKVVSPIDFVVHISPIFTGVTRVEMIGEYGEELYRKVFKTYPNLGYFTRVDEKINFEIKGAAEIARLQVSTYDSVGRIQSLSSVRLLLQAVGDNELTSANVNQDRLILRTPQKDAEIHGTALLVEGEFLPVNGQPVVVEVVDESGIIQGSRVLQFDAIDGNYQPFSTSIPFEVKGKTPVRLVFRQSDDRMKGLLYLISSTIILLP